METLVQDQEEVDSQFWDLTRRALSITDEEKTEVLNIWQKWSEATGTVVTPANMIDAAAFAGGMYGIHNFDSWKGIGVAAVSFCADMVDGKVARATKTQSPLGEAVDATGDKVKLAYALYKIWKLDLAPKSLVTAVTIQNGANVLLTTADRALNDEPVLHPTQFGKKAILLQQFGLGLHVVGSELSKTNERKGKFVKRTGTILGWAGVGLGIVATTDYTNTVVSAVKNRKSKRSK